ncbi:piggyBac transposable element-derived protein 4-like [Vespula squamosa]|uniref:PiggyBac transposable element-derived protein 4-like n=1 Tax=Vespula squamosa TaxID=30214 RepID=A0ABD2BH63_VESSQ
MKKKTFSIPVEEKGAKEFYHIPKETGTELYSRILKSLLMKLFGNKIVGSSTFGRPSHSFKLRIPRLKTDKFALISNAWNRFIENSQNNYKPHMNLSIDERLFPTKVKCKFMQYIPSNGIKFWHQVLGLSYLGKEETPPSSTPLDKFLYSKWSNHLYDTRDITINISFMCASLATELMEK